MLKQNKLVTVGVLTMAANSILFNDGRAAKEEAEGGDGRFLIALECEVGCKIHWQL